MRFCGTGRKLCGKICIKASDVCRKVRASKALEAHGSNKANIIRASGFNKIALNSSVKLTLNSMPIKKF